MGGGVPLIMGNSGKWIFNMGIHIILNDDINLEKSSDLTPVDWGNDMNVFEKEEKMKGIIKTSQDYFSYLRTVFVGKMLTSVLIEENDVENELSKIKENFNRIYSNKRAKNFVRSSSLNQKFWKIVLTRWKKEEDFPEPVNYDFDFENQNFQIISIFSWQKQYL